MTIENEPEVVEQSLDTAEVPEVPGEEPKTYDADYVNGLKQESIDHRHKATTLATRLHTELVRQTGRLADPTELGFDAAHLEDPEALTAAIDELLTRKPHYATRTPHGNVGQGAKDQGAQPLNLVTHLKSLV
jgi:hypothetical protein